MAYNITLGRFFGPPGGTIETYQAGTLTPLATYTTAAGTTPNPTTIAIPASGYVPVWGGSGRAYRFIVKDSDGVVVYDQDNIVDPGDGVAADVSTLELDLADSSVPSKGAAKVGVFEPIGAAVPYVKTISDIINGMPVSFLRFVPNTQHAAILAGTSTVDHHPNLQTAVNAAPVLSFEGLRRVQIGNNVDLPDADVTITGAGRIHGTHAGYVFGQVNRGRLFKLRGLTFTGIATAFRYDGGAGIYGTQVYEYEIDSCKFLQDATYSAIVLISAREGTIRNCYFENNDGVYTLRAINAEMVGLVGKNCGRLVYYDTGSEGLKFIGGTALGCTTAIQAWQSAGVQIIGSMLDYNDTSVVINGCSEVVISGNYISGRNSAAAVRIKAAGAVRSRNVKIIGNPAIISNDTMATANDCLLIEDTDYFEVASNTVTNWQVRGIKTGNGCTFGEIHHNRVEPKTGTGTHSIVTGTGDDTIAIDGNTVGKPMSLTSTTKVRRNSGWTTENRGEITSSTGVTTVNIPHGLSMTPLKRDVTLVPTSAVQAGLRWWLSGTDATNITITTDPAITTAISWKWEATIQA